eukprot:scaffold95099_cov16-Tisochrysis_lutea.AAC.1
MLELNGTEQQALLLPAASIPHLRRLLTKARKASQSQQTSKPSTKRSSKMFLDASSGSGAPSGGHVQGITGHTAKVLAGEFNPNHANKIPH